jgi:2-polyprenyl-3-methyl-5-hydroxy-6-metoxy-1,4-benzoquinol methylase
MRSTLGSIARRAVKATGVLRPGTRLIRFGVYHEPENLNRTQQMFIQWNAERLSIPTAESRARYIASLRTLPGGHRGIDYREFSVLSHEIFRAFHSDSPAEVFEAYQFHGALHFLRLLSYDDDLRIDNSVVDDLGSLGNVCIVDYGCGLAQSSIALAERLRARGVGVTLVLVDIPTIVTTFLRWMTGKLGLVAEFILCDASQPYPVLPPCHLCVATEVFEHLHNPLNAFDNVDAALRPGGYLCADVSDHRAEFFHVSPALGELRSQFQARSYLKVGPAVYRKGGSTILPSQASQNTS